jgi:hypothetical protein
MTEKNQQEKNAAERQVELLTNAFDKAQENGGVWLNKDGKQAPKFYRKVWLSHHFMPSSWVLQYHNTYKTMSTPCLASQETWRECTVGSERCAFQLVQLE